MRTLQRLIIPALDVCPEVELYVRLSGAATLDVEDGEITLRQRRRGAHRHLLRRLLARSVERADHASARRRRTRPHRGVRPRDDGHEPRRGGTGGGSPARRRLDVDGGRARARRPRRGSAVVPADLRVGRRRSCADWRCQTADEPARDVHLGVVDHDLQPHGLRRGQPRQVGPDVQGASRDRRGRLDHHRRQRRQPRTADPRRHAGGDRQEPEPRRCRRLRPWAVGAPPARTGDPCAVHGRRRRVRAGGDRPDRCLPALHEG